MSVPGTQLAFPAHIYRGENSLQKLPAYLAKQSRNILLIGGHHSLAATETTIRELLTPFHNLTTAFYGGEVTEENGHALAAKAKEMNADLVLCVGGGKAMDTGKLAAELAGLPIITIPTIAATCAGVSTVSILYFENGHFRDFYHLKQAPELVILDPEIIAKSPTRWLAAGIGDTLAKLYEYRAITNGKPDYSLNIAAFANGKVCFEVLTTYGPVAYEKAKDQLVSSELIQVMDAIFIYAAFTSIMGIGAHASAAHGLYEGFTVIDKTRHFGHGLLVGYGNICLLALEQRTDAELLEAIQVAKSCGIPTSLKEIATLTDEELQTVAQASAETEDMHNMPMPITAADIIAAMQRVDALSERV